MQIVIDIPERMYDMINAGIYDYGDMNIIIRNGTPLPEHHDDMEGEKNCDTCQFDGMCSPNVRLIVKHNGCPKWTPKQTTMEEGDGE